MAKARCVNAAWRPAWAGLALLVMASALAGCGLPPKFRIDERTASHFDEAGAVSVAVVSHGRWESLVQDLSPGFELTAAQALERTAQATRSLEESTLQAARLALRLAPQQRTQRSELTERIEDDAHTSTSSRKRVAAPGDPMALDTPNAPDLSAPAAPSRAGSSAALDPTVHYHLATALRQEVALLNRYLDAAPVLDGYERFFVRLDVQVRPHGRKRPYDLESTIAFFANSSPPALAPCTPGAAPPAGLAGRGGVIAVPLLAGHSKDIASIGAARQSVMDIGLALSLVQRSFGLVGDLGQR